MRDINDATITEEVLRRFEGTPDARLRQIMLSLVKHAHAFVRDVELTPEEWMAAISYLTRTGQISVGGRQEFILLSDTLGVSMLVDAINNAAGSGVTASTVLGPFYLDNPPVLDQGADISGKAEGEPLYVEAEVRSGDTPLADAIVDVWQSDSEGFYDVQRSDLEGPQLRGRFRTDAAGRVRFWSILPTAYPIPDDGPVGEMLKATNRHPWRPAHLHFMIAAPGHRTLTTHIFVDGDAYLESDAVFGVKSSLIDAFPAQPPGEAPDGRRMDRPWRRLNYAFGLAPA
jgi:hydroxyquinol 1,2-dioxygenase